MALSLGLSETSTLVYARFVLAFTVCTTFYIIFTSIHRDSCSYFISLLMYIALQHCVNWYFYLFHTKVWKSISVQSIYRADFPIEHVKSKFYCITYQENDGVSEVIDMMNCYDLQREDWDNIMELSTYSPRPNPATCVNSKVKAAFTRFICIL